MNNSKTKAKPLYGRIRLVLTLSYLSYLLFLMIMPPYYVMDQASVGTIHAPAGHHFFWSPPDAQDAALLLDKMFPERKTPGPEEGAPHSYAVNLNKIRLVIFVIFGTVAYLLASVLLKRIAIYGSKKA